MKSEFQAPFISRRSFLQRLVPVTAGATVAANTIRELRLMNSALAQASGINDYKALICVFLNGGNDANNLIIPTLPSEWQNYSNIRTPAVALPNVDGTGATAQSLNLPSNLPYHDPAGHTYGFHPAMPELAALFKSGKVAPVLNVGTLSFPMTKAQYTSNSVPKPPQLFSHSDQQTQWQTSLPDQPYTSGWAGRMADLFTQPTDVNSGGQVSMAVTLAGSNIFEVGNVNAAPQYAITTGGAVTLSNPSGTIAGMRQSALQSILNADKTLADLQTKTYAQVLDHAIAEATVLTNALAGNATATYLNNFPTKVITPNDTSTAGLAGFTSSLMSQMKMVARLIDLGSKSVLSGGLGMKRQIFFIQVGGYDTHTNQTSNAGSTSTNNASVVIGAQANLLAELSQTLNGLMNAMSSLGLSQQVTAFTVSDFARTFPSNGSGSDHGWGSHHLVVGGAVNGGATYGKFPTLAVNGPDDTGIGRWIPTTSVDQYAATLASWFGVSQPYISTVFPNLGRFASSNLGFI